MPPKKPKSKHLPNISLTDTEYDEIFDAVINQQQSSQDHQQLLDFKSPLIGKSPEVIAISPKECASLENSQNASQEPVQQKKTKKATNTKKTEIVSSNKPKQFNSESSNNQSESMSTIHSEEFRKNAIFSTPERKGLSVEMKQRSFREAVKNLKQTESQLSDSLLVPLSQAQSSLNNSMLVDTPLSQPPANLNHLERLLWLQARRGDNVFVQCDTCDKWRLSDVQDPVDLPEMWYCYMNKDLNFSNCSVPEQKLSMYLEADIILNQYTAGTLVWAKIYTYPWWPAMVDDDPDTEQYYWIEDYDLNIPTSYNVTFFDGKNEMVTRAWIPAKNLKSFKHNLNLDKKSGNNKFKARMRYAKAEAMDAMNLSIKERLSKYSFISKTKKRINTPVATPTHSEDEMNSKAIDGRKRRYTVDDPAAQLKNRFLEKSKKELEHIKGTKSIKKRRNTVVATSRHQEDGEERVQRRRNSISDRYSLRGSSSDLVEPKKNTRGNTSLDTSVERDSSLSLDSIKEKKITKRRTTIAESSRESRKSAIDYDFNKLVKIQQRRNSVPDRYSLRGSSSDLVEPQKVGRRRNTRLDSSVESFSQDLIKEKKITKRRSTIVEQTSREQLDKSTKGINEIKETKETKEKKIQRRRISIPDRYSERDSSQDLVEPKKVTRRKISISGRDSSRNSSTSEMNRSRNISNDTSVERESTFSEDSKQSGKITRRRKTIGKYDEQNAIEDLKVRRRNSQKDSSQDSNVSKPMKENNIKRRRNTVHEKDWEMPNESEKITKRRSTLSEYDSQKSNKEPKKRRNSNSTRDSQRDSSQNSDESRKITKRRSTRLDSSVEKENTSNSEEPKKEKKITKRRVTIAEYNYQSFNAEKEESHNSQGNEIGGRRNTIDQATSLTDLSVRSEGGMKTIKRRSKFVCPVPNVKEAAEDLNELQSEAKKYRKTLGARKIVSSGNPLKNMKGSESGYESAISVKAKGRKQNLSMILEESYSKLNISKNTDDKKKMMGEDDELENTFTSLSESLERLDEEKRKKKFRAICQEIVNVDKDPEDPTISEKEKIFYEKLNSSLKQVKEKRDNAPEETFMKKVEAFENKLDEVEFKETKNKDELKLCLKSISNTSMYSDISDV